MKRHDQSAPKLRLMSILAPHGVLQNDQASIVADNTPLLDFFDGSKTT
jgi:hypothetical protein